MNADIQHPNAGDLRIRLKSPSGTESYLAFPRHTLHSEGKNISFFSGSTLLFTLPLESISPGNFVMTRENTWVFF